MSAAIETRQLDLSFITPGPVWVYDDGGREAAGIRHPKTVRAAMRSNCAGETAVHGDCVVRAIAIATEIPYAQVLSELREQSGLNSLGISGVGRNHYEPYLLAKGWEWVPTMGIGTGCTVHLIASELPHGRLIVRVSGHMVAVIDGVIRDIYDPARGGSRCVYGYFRKVAQS